MAKDEKVSADQVVRDIRRETRRSGCLTHRDGRWGRNEPIVVPEDVTIIEQIF